MVEFQPEGVLFVRPFLAVTTGIVVLFVGKALARRVALLREYNIPEPVTGGLLFAAAFWLLYLVSGIPGHVRADGARRAPRLLLHDHRDQRTRERSQGRRATARPPACGGGGVHGAAERSRRRRRDPGRARPRRSACSPAASHGSAGTAPRSPGRRSSPSNAGSPTRSRSALLSATVGLVLASVAGGPVARFLVRRHRLEGPPARRPMSACTTATPSPASTTSRSCARSSRSTCAGSSASSPTSGWSASA